MKYIHGDYSLNVIDNVVIIHAKGPWNRACVDSFQKDYWAITREFQDKTYNELLYLDGESILVPEAAERLAAGLPHSFEHGLRKIAVVLKNCETRFLTQKQFEKIYQIAPVNFAFFASEEEAQRWLGFTVAVHTPIQADSRLH